MVGRTDVWNTCIDLTHYRSPSLYAHGLMPHRLTLGAVLCGSVGGEVVEVKGHRAAALVALEPVVRGDRQFICMARESEMSVEFLNADTFGEAPLYILNTCVSRSARTPS